MLQFSPKGEIAMITAVVKFRLQPEMSRDKWQEHIKQVSARFQNVPGLISKQFLYNDEGIGAVCIYGKRARQPRTVITKALGAKTCARLRAVMSLR